MASGMFDGLEDALLEHIFLTTALTAYGTAYLGLTTTACAEGAIGTEVSGGSYARVDVSGGWTISNGEATNTNAIRFPKATANWGTAVNLFIALNSTGSTKLSFYVDFTGLGDPTINSGRLFEIPAGALTIRTINSGSSGRSSSSYADGSMLDHVLNNVTWAKPAGTWVALSNTDPTRTGSGMSEPDSADNYSRVQVPQTAAGWAVTPLGTGMVHNTADIVWDPAEPDDWISVYYYGIFDAATGGNMLWWSALNFVRTMLAGYSARIVAANLTMTLV